MHIQLAKSGEARVSEHHYGEEEELRYSIYKHIVQHEKGLYVRIFG